ncbi:MAG TPA: tRNA ligase [Lactobacillus sp.]|nr:tRNA ligase [Lactobacillus sp.]
MPTLFPQVTIAIITAHGIDNKSVSQVPTTLLTRANEVAPTLVPNDPISNNEIVKAWRDAFKKFKTDKGTRSAIENLLKRAKNGNPVRSINPLVDIYNSVSLEYGFPVGCLDLDKVTGTLRLTVAKGTEHFSAIGEDDDETALPGEVIYRDDTDVTSRQWAWRDSARTEATADTQNVVMYMECLKPDWQNQHRQAIDCLEARFAKYLGTNCEVSMVSKDMPTTTFK